MRSDGRSRFVSLVLVVFLGITSLAVHAAPETRQYQLHQRSAADVARQVRDLYASDNLTVTAQGQQLMVRGEPRVLDEIGDLVSTLDVAPVQMRITVRSTNTGMGKQGGAGVTITNDQASVNVERKVTSTQSSQERSLIVQEGQSAQITNGQVRAIPLAIQGGRNPALLLEQIETRSGFVVSPQFISNDAVELNILSFEEDPDSGVPGYETEALMTLRRVEPGQWITLGSVRQSRSGDSAGIVYQTGSNSQQNQTWQVRVDVM